MIVRRRNIAVMAAIVIDAEVALARNREHRFRKVFLEFRVLVAKLMASINCEPGSEPRDCGQ